MGAQITGLFIGLALFYYYIVKLVIPNLLGVKKLRTKKNNQNIHEKIVTKHELSNFIKLINYKLIVFLKKN